MNKTCVLILLALGGAVQGGVQVCPLPADTQFKPFQNTVQNGPTKFQWYSDAAPNPAQGGGHPSYAFERKVTNLGRGALKYDWPIGRMRNEALPEGASPDSYCHEYGWPNQKDGPLNYGRGNDSTATTIWEGKDEPKAPSTISARLAFTLIEGASARRVVVGVQSWADERAEGFHYTYVLINLGESATILDWQLKISEFSDALHEKKLTTPIRLPAGQSVEISFFSKVGPKVDFKEVQLLAEKSEQLAGADVPTLLPNTQPEK